MTTAPAVVRLSLLVALLALIAAGIGLFWPGGDGSIELTSLRGEAVELYGRGIYQHDTRFVGSLNRGTDAAVLLVAIPLLLVATAWYRRGALRSRLLLAAVLAYVLYIYASAALGATASNELFLVYVALFGASLFALLRLLTAIDLDDLATQISPQAPWRAAGIFMVVCGVVTTAIWLGLGLVPKVLTGQSPEHLDTYATPVTDALDLGILTPASFVVGALLLRRRPLGYLLVIPLLGILALLAPTFAAQTFSQTSAGVSFSPAEIIGPISEFVLLSVVAIRCLAALLHQVDETAWRWRPSAGASDRMDSAPTTGVMEGVR